MKKFRKILFTALILLSYIAKATITVNYSPKNISLGETIKITFTIDSANKVGSPNLMPLLNDFDVLSTARSFSFADINGKTSSQAQWTIILKPKHAGTINIPPINIGNEQSKPFTMTVAKTSNQETETYNNNSTYTILEATINETQPFIEQQTIYTVKLYNRQQLFDGQYKAPEIENALIVPLGDGKSYQTSFKGENYNVEEISYAIFPQKEGKITITPPEFTAEVIDGFNPTRIHLIAKPISINVKPLTDGQKISDWLAAENVTLSEDYDNQATTYTAGETIVRNITLQASGMVAELLPKLIFSNSDSYNVYANKPHVENNLVDGKIIARATYKVTYLLTKASSTEIPAIELPWYNIDNKTKNIATLPAKIIHINPNSAASKKIIPISKPKEVIKPQSKARTSLLPILGIILFALVIIIGIVILKLASSKSKKPKINPSLYKIQKACKACDPVTARQAILAFARQEWPEKKILNLNNIPIDNQEFKQEIAKLTAALYGKGKNTTWDGTKLWQIFSKLKTRKANKKTKKILPPIYLH